MGYLVFMAPLKACQRKAVVPFDPKRFVDSDSLLEQSRGKQAIKGDGECASKVLYETP